MLQHEEGKAGTTSWGALALCFSTVCVCATAVAITHMILEGRRLVPLPLRPPAVTVSAPAAPARPASAPAPAPAPAEPTPATAPAPPPAPPEVEGNFVRNGDFEQLGGEGASIFEHWGYWGRWEKGDYTLESAPGRTGQRAARIACVKPGRGGLSQPLQGCKPGDKLQITFWLKADNAVGGRIFLNLEGTPGDGWASMDLKPGTYDWKEFTKVVTCPPSNASDYRIVIFFYNKSQGDILLDDVAAVKLAQ